MSWTLPRVWSGSDAWIYHWQAMFIAGQRAGVGRTRLEPPDPAIHPRQVIPQIGHAEMLYAVNHRGGSDIGQRIVAAGEPFPVTQRFVHAGQGRPQPAP